MGPGGLLAASPRLRQRGAGGAQGSGAEAVTAPSARAVGARPSVTLTDAGATEMPGTGSP